MADDTAPTGGAGAGPTGRTTGADDSVNGARAAADREVATGASRAAHVDVDPLDEAPPTTPRGSLALTVVAVVLGVLALLPTGLSFVLGPIGMGCGLVAHLKGRRAGFGAAVFAGVATVVGLSVRTLMDIY